MNHMYRDIPAKPGSVAACGIVKKSKRGFIEGAPTCSGCVEAALQSAVGAFVTLENNQK